MPEELLGLLRRKRALLNRAIAAHRFLVYAAPSALAAGLLVALLRALGAQAASFALWAILAAAGGAAGAVVARRSLVDAAGTARWLDIRLLSAALACAGRESPGRFDEIILAKAALLVPAAAAMRPPRRPIAKRAAVAALSLAIGAYAVFLSSYAQPSEAGAVKKTASSSESASPTSSSALSAALETGGQAASDFARALFPDDKRMSTLVERALREGRLDDLGDLINAAGLELDSKLAGSVSELDRKKLTRERESLFNASRTLAMKAQASRSSDFGGSGQGEQGEAGQGGSDSKGEASSDPYPRGQGQGQEAGGASGNQGPPGRSPNAESGSAAGEGDDNTGGTDGGSDSGGGFKSGKGSSGIGQGSGEEGNWGRIKPAAGAKKAPIPSSPSSSFFELVLPGSEAKVPIAKLAPSSQKSAEAASSREELPLEYEDFVKSYFMTLSQGQGP
jgi:hypothetical protein